MYEAESMCARRNTNNSSNKLIHYLPRCSVIYSQSLNLWGWMVVTAQKFTWAEEGGGLRPLIILIKQKRKQEWRWKKKHNCKKWKLSPQRITSLRAKRLPLRDV